MAFKVLAALLALLSIAAGLAKVMLVPEETAFLDGFGFSSVHIVIFGAVQIFGGALLAVPFSRVVGGITVAAGFLFSAVLVFMSGNMVFGGVSLLPVILAGVVVYRAMRVVSPVATPGSSVEE
jgi:hypothetical protein